MTSPLSTQEREQSGNRAAGWLSVALVVLAVGIATTSVLGPVGLGLMRYRTSPTTLNQLLGSDAASLFVVAPLTLVAAGLTARRHPVGPLLALGVGVYALYIYAQIVIGQEYLRLPGNVERFFPLLLAVFLVAEAVVVLAWRLAPPTPRPTPRLERTAAIVLLLVAVFLVFGQHLRPDADSLARSDCPDRVRLQPHSVLDGEADGSGHHRPGRGRYGGWPPQRSGLGASRDVCPVHRLHLPGNCGCCDGFGDVRQCRS